MWQTKYALAVPKDLGVGVNFWPCSEGYFHSPCRKSSIFNVDLTLAQTVLLQSVPEEKVVILIASLQKISILLCSRDNKNQ